MSEKSEEDSKRDARGVNTLYEIAEEFLVDDKSHDERRTSTEMKKPEKEKEKVSTELNKILEVITGESDGPNKHVKLVKKT